MDENITVILSIALVMIIIFAFVPHYIITTMDVPDKVFNRTNDLLFTVILTIFTFFGAYSTYLMYNLERNRAKREEPDLRYTNQSCNHLHYIGYNFIIDNIGEKATSIKNVKLVSVNNKEVDIDPYNMLYWIDGNYKSSFIMFIRPRSTLTINTEYNYENLNQYKKLKLKFKLIHTTSTLNMEAESILTE